MLDFFKFIFSSFWYFCGFVIILLIIIEGITQIVGAITTLITRKSDKKDD